jgi:hypothetical protein
MNRLLKEVSYYRKEEDQRKKVEKFVVDGAEDWDIKNGVSFLDFLLPSFLSFFLMKIEILLFFLC